MEHHLHTNFSYFGVQVYCANSGLYIKVRLDFLGKLRGAGRRAGWEA